jgi:hypothetical protein
VSIAACLPLGIIAWIIGKRDLARMSLGRMDRSGESLTTMGYCLGVAATLVFGMSLVLLVPALACLFLISWH